MDRISINPAILGGKPCVRGTRLSVELVVGCVRRGMTVDQIIDSYPHLKPEDIQACVEYDAAHREETPVDEGIGEPYPPEDDPQYFQRPIDRDLTPREAGDQGVHH